MLRICFNLVYLLIFPLLTIAQNKLPEQITLLFYNVDNMYDITDDQGNDDNDYHPASLKAWDEKRYDLKIKNIAENISLAGDFKRPDLIGICGVENKKVINDIINDRRLRRDDYSIHMIDLAGTDVALLAKKDILNVKDMQLIEIDTTFLGRNNGFHYNILYINAFVKGLGKCHFYLNDWPGIENNSRAPENLRIGAAIALRKSIDEIFNFERDAKIIIMGTFNDEPTNRSLMTVLNATNKRHNIDHRDLYNLYYDTHNINNMGTVFINDTWQMWDQIIVSSSLIRDRNGYHIEYSSGMIFNPAKDNKERSKPASTYDGDNYTGCTSSHLPVYCIIKKSKQ
ncbi:MAG TPA: hypothetical protein DEQ09_03845 [Bacteroidales bacterium]|nr:hypothetical protein [Bacteroidales bacterium]